MDREDDSSEMLKLFDKEERGYFARLRDMFVGLMRSRDSIEYKEALRELQRQWAPLLGVAIPIVIAVVMCSITIGGGEPPERGVEVTFVEPDVGPPLDPIDPPPPPETIETPDDLVSDVIASVPSPPLGDPVPNTPPTAQPPVMPTRSPVIFKGIPSRGAGGGGLGGGVRLEGDMVGMFIDLSKDARGNLRPEFQTVAGRSSYVNKDRLLFKDVHYMISNGLSREAFRPYNVVPQKVFLSHLVLPYVKSSIGPTTYKVEKSVKKGAPWVAVYKGQLQPEKDGLYRLAGIYDDVLVVRVNGKEVLEFTWESRFNGVGQPSPIGTGWTQKDAAVAGKHRMKGFQGVPLTYGDWFPLKAGQSVPVEILIGDNGGDGGEGGLTGGILLVERQGETYAKTPDGVPLLPPFATTRLTFTERERLAQIADPTNAKTSGHYAFSAKDIPVMNTCGKARPSMTEGDVTVDVGDL